MAPVVSAPASTCSPHAAAMSAQRASAAAPRCGGAPAAGSLCCCGALCPRQDAGRMASAAGAQRRPPSCAARGGGRRQPGCPGTAHMSGPTSGPGRRTAAARRRGRPPAGRQRVPRRVAPAPAPSHGREGRAGGPTSRTTPGRPLGAAATPAPLRGIVPRPTSRPARPLLACGLVVIAERDEGASKWAAGGRSAPPIKGASRAWVHPHCRTGERAAATATRAQTARRRRGRPPGGRRPRRLLQPARANALARLRSPVVRDRGLRSRCGPSCAGAGAGAGDLRCGRFNEHSRGGVGARGARRRACRALARVYSSCVRA